MALIIFPPATFQSDDSGSSGDGHSHSNLFTLNGLSTDTSGNLCFKGKIVAENAIEVVHNITLNNSLVAQKFISLPDDCDTSRAITLSLNGVAFTQGDFWEVSEKNYPDLDSIVWAGLGLDGLVQVGDKISISYYKKV